MKALFISYQDDGIVSGGAITSLRNLDFLKRYFGDENVYRIEIFHHKNILLKYLINSFNPSSAENRMIVRKIKEGYTVLFVDYTFGGGYFYNLKRKFPNITIIKFFHDINCIRLLELKNDKTIPYFSLKGECRFKYSKHYKVSCNSDKSIIECSDLIITLHQRDSELLGKLFGKTADFFLPISLPIPAYEYSGEGVNPLSDKPMVLFVGSTKYSPNKSAVVFLSSVVKRAGYSLYVIGATTEDVIMELSNENVVFVGKKNNLAPYYQVCDVVALPIFSGGGMKVKTCEALSYGKTILGTNEAFVGYELDYGEVGALCNTEEEFVDALLKYKQNPKKRNAYSKEVFLNHYSHNAVFEAFKCNMDRFFADKIN